MPLLYCADPKLNAVNLAETMAEQIKLPGRHWSLDEMDDRTKQHYIDRAQRLLDALVAKGLLQVMKEPQSRGPCVIHDSLNCPHCYNQRCHSCGQEIEK